MIDSGTDLTNELWETIKNLDKAIDGLGRTGREKADAEFNYRIALRKEIIKEQLAGQKVTVISDICRGQEKVATLRHQRDIAESNYQTNIEAINAWKLKIRILESLISKEWGRS